MARMICFADPLSRKRRMIYTMKYAVRIKGLCSVLPCVLLVLAVECLTPVALSEPTVPAASTAVAEAPPPTVSEPPKPQSKDRPEAQQVPAAPVNKTAPGPAADAGAQETQDKWGIQIASLHLSAGGNIVDFRYRVVNPEKALPLFDRRAHPVLIDEATGAKFCVPNPPKVGSLRSTRPPKADRNYFMLFANPGGYIKVGSSVTITAGEFKAEHLVVQ
jgi:hypothetical protein